MLREYLDGRRQQHFKPVLLVLILGSISTLLSHYVYPEKETAADRAEKLRLDKDIQESKLNNIADVKGLVRFMENILHWLSTHLSFVILFFIPLTAFAFFIAFKKYKINYPEWLVIMSFLAGQALVIDIFITLLELFPVNLQNVFFIAAFGMFLWTMLQLFRTVRKRSVILRTAFGWFLSLFFNGFATIIAVLIFLAVGMYKYGNEDTIEKLENSTHRIIIKKNGPVGINPAKN